MSSRQFEILVVGRCAGDLVLSNEYAVGMENVGVRVKKDDGSDYFIGTNSLPSADNDKVSSLIDLGEFIARHNYMFRWGGGGFNSTKALADLRARSPQMSITLLTPSRPELFLGTEKSGVKKSLVDYLNTQSINSFFMNFITLNYNIILGGDNKIVIRNKQSGSYDFKLNRENRSAIDGYISPSDGILINALNDLDMTSTMVEAIFNENQLFLKNESAFLDKNSSFDALESRMNSPDRLSEYKHRKILTVITPTNRISRSELVDKIIPYTGLVFNLEDAIKIFYGNDKEIIKKVYSQLFDEKDGKKSFEIKDYTPILKILSQLRNGIPTEHGVRRTIEDPNDNVYITLGKRGHIVSVGNKAYHLLIKDEIIDIINKKILENKSSTSGAGDAFAAGVVHQETRGFGKHVKSTAAFANATVCKYLGINIDIIPSEVRILNEFTLAEHYTEQGLERIYRP